jgi:hypothetical protein
VKRRYRFFVPAPRRPGGASRLRFRAIKRIRPGSGHQRIRVKRNGIAVAVSLKRVRRPVRYGRSFVVWWSGPATRRPTPLKIKLKSLFIRHSDPEPIYRATRSPWNLYLNLNGYWKRLNEWLPQLRAVHDGQRIAVNHTVKIYVPRGHRLWLQLGGRECDEPGRTTVFGTFANVVHPCPANKTEINPNPFKLLSNDDTGTILDVYRSARAALGRHVSTSLAEPRWPGTGRTGLRQGPKGQGNRAFDLTYVVRRARR